MHCCLMYVFHFFIGYSFIVLVLDSFFFIWETKKVVAGHIRQVVILYSTDCKGICLGRLSIGCLRRVVILYWLFEQLDCNLVRKRCPI